MSKKIFYSSFCVALFVLISVTAVIMGILFNVFEHQLQNELQREAQYIAAAVENDGVSFLENLTEDNKRITYVSPSGEVMFDTEAEASELDNHANREEIKTAMENGSGMSIRYSKTLTEKTVYYALRLKDGSVLRISTKQYTVFTILMGLLQPFLVVMVIAVIISLILAMRISKSITKPINEIDLDNPQSSEVYSELQPLLRKIETQKQTIIKEAEEKNAFRREFTANISHELKTPLTSISGFAELMKEGGTPDELVMDFSSSIYDEAQRLISLVSDIIKLSELDEKNIGYDKENVDLYLLSEEVVKRLAAEAEKHAISMTVTGDHAQIYGIKKILFEIIYNLCDNAIKYNRENGSVKVNVLKRNGVTELTVNDTGVGIPSEHCERVFERFYRVDKSHSKNVGGTGLGLAIVKHGVIYHNADIRLKSEVGKGTSITIIFKG